VSGWEEVGGGPSWGRREKGVWGVI